MYGCITKTPVGDVDFKVPDDIQEIAYWRKHPNLHGWMEDLYYRKGGAQTFNCTTVRLDAADIDALEKAVNDNNLPQTNGFFFGETRPEEVELDRAFITKAREALGAGYAVFYDSWW
jgi:hypothetical protein